MCGNGCICFKVAEPTATNKRESHFLKTYLVEKDGKKNLMATDGCSTVKINLNQYIEKTGARIIEP